MFYVFFMLPVRLHLVLIEIIHGRRFSMNEGLRTGIFQTAKSWAPTREHAEKSTAYVQFPIIE